MEEIDQGWNERLVGLLSQTNRAYLVALRACGDAALAEDAVQEGFVELLQRSSRDISDEQLPSYFLGIVRNLAMNRLRSSLRLKARAQKART
jgi:DNA-directed RNA polymerase specialized sigma24 family protein